MLIWNSPSVDSSMLELGNYPAGCLLCAFIPPDPRSEGEAPGWKRPSHPTWKSHVGQQSKGETLYMYTYHHTKRQKRCYRRYAGKGKTNLNTKAAWKKYVT